MKNRMFSKLAASIAMLGVAAAAVTTGTLAWFTISNKTEVQDISVAMISTGKEYPFEFSSDYDPTNPGAATWTQNLYIDNLSSYGNLRPITTADMTHWYLPLYDAEGNVSSFYEANLQDICNQTDTEDKSNYIVAFDFYVRTKDEDNYFGLQLSTPEYSMGGENTGIGDGETDFGTYLVTWPVLTTDNVYMQTSQSYGCMAIARVGIIGFDGSGNAEGAMILEPNVDLAGDFSMYTRDDGNMVGINYQSDEMKNLHYIVGSSLEVGDNAPTEASQRATVVPQYAGYGRVNMVEQTTVRQYTSSWNIDSLGRVMRDDVVLTGSDRVDSRSLAEIGAFLDESPILTHLGQYEDDGTTPMVRQVRVFIWLEGQDVDCWNQTAGGAIYANLEFSGQLCERNLDE